jgi:hypothetical protein
MKPIFKKSLLTGIIFTLINQLSIAQTNIAPGDTAIHYQYLKSRNVFQKLSWLNKDGQIMREAVLNLVTRIDTVKHTITHLQIRNDAKKDSSVSTYPGLKPLYLLSLAAKSKTEYDYRAGTIVKVHDEQNGKVTFDGSATLTYDYFDPFLSEFIISGLPLEKLKPIKFNIFKGDTRTIGSIEISKILPDVILLPNGNTTPVFVLNMKSGPYEYLVYVDKRSRQMLKTVFGLPNGGYFIKALI